jgi:phosphatidylinositol alpha-1,6-mannosyltransferase
VTRKARLETDPPILVVTSTFPDHDRDIRGRFLADLLASLPFRFRVVCPRGPAFGVLSSPTVERLPFRNRGVFQTGGGAVSNMSNRRVRLPAVMLTLLSMLYTALRAAPRSRLVWSHWAVPGGVVGAVCRLCFGVRHAVLLHSGDVWFLETRRWGRLVARFVAAHTDQLFGVNEDVVERFARLSGLRGEVLGCGVERNREARPSGSAPRLGMLSRLVPSKGVTRLLELGSEIAAEIHVAGDGPDKEAVNVLCNQLPHAVFHGPVVGQPKQRLLASFDVFAAPYLAASWGQTEGTPMSALEAMAAGCAVVAFRSALPRGLVDPDVHGILVPDRDFRSFVEAIGSLLGDPERRARLGAAARARVEPYLLDRVAVEWREVLTKLSSG